MVGVPVMVKDKYAVRLQGTTGRTPAFDSGGGKLRPSDRPSADSLRATGWAAPQVAEALDVALGTWYRILSQRFTGEGLARALRDRPQANRHQVG